MLLAFGACSGKKDENKNENKENGNTIEEPATPKNQVVHVGETVQYGDLTFTFEKTGDTYQLEGFSDNYPFNYSRYICIHIVCAYNGTGEVYLSEESFKTYINGNQADGSSRSRELLRRTNEYGPYYDMYEEQTGYNYKNGWDGITLTSGRSSDLWLLARIDTDDVEAIVEFDYVNSAYSDEWGKVTFAVDLP